MESIDEIKNVKPIPIKTMQATNNVDIILDFKNNSRTLFTNNKYNCYNKYRGGYMTKYVFVTGGVSQ